MLRTCIRWSNDHVALTNDGTRLQELASIYASGIPGAYVQVVAFCMTIRKCCDSMASGIWTLFATRVMLEYPIKIC